MDALNVLSAQLTRDLFAIAMFLFIVRYLETAQERHVVTADH